MDPVKLLADKREGACLSGPCRMPKRCWQYATCFLYGEGVEKVGTQETRVERVSDVLDSDRSIRGSDTGATGLGMLGTSRLEGGLVAERF